MSEKNIEKNWFGELLLNFAPRDIQVEGQTVEELIRNASWKAFAASTLLALPPGPLGLATILPELLAITKIQINLVYAIAKLKGKEAKLNDSLVALIFAHEAGLQIGRYLSQNFGDKVVVRSLSKRALGQIAEQIGLRIGIRVTQKALGRWVPIVFAPVFGALSKKMTERIGEEAAKLFDGEIELEDVLKCTQGHEVEVDWVSCPVCGESVSNLNLDQ